MASVVVVFCNCFAMTSPTAMPLLLLPQNRNGNNKTSTAANTWSTASESATTKTTLSPQKKSHSTQHSMDPVIMTTCPRQSCHCHHCQMQQSCIHSLLVASSWLLTHVSQSVHDFPCLHHDAHKQNLFKQVSTRPNDHLTGQH